MKLILVLFTFVFSINAYAAQGMATASSSYWSSNQEAAQTNAGQQAAFAARDNCKDMGWGYDWGSRDIAEGGCEVKSTSGGIKYKCTASARMMCTKKK